MQDILMEAFVCLGKIRDAIETKQADGEALGLLHFIDEPETISDIIAELYNAHTALR